MKNQIFSDQGFPQHLYTGPIAPHLDSFAVALSEQGYAKATVKVKIRVVSKLSQWLQKRHLVIEDINESCINKFIRYRKKRSLLRSDDQVALRHLIAFLREEGIILPLISEINVSDIQRTENSFAQYLQQVRGLSQPTIDNYIPTIRRFLTKRFGKIKIIYKNLCSRDISKYVLCHAHTMSPGRAKTMVNALRSFFRFLHQRGETAIDLASAVPTVARWEFSEIPKFLQPEQVKRILENGKKSN